MSPPPGSSRPSQDCIWEKERVVLYGTDRRFKVFS